MTPTVSIESADWITERLHPFSAYDVGAVVPTGFAAYARILHPAWTSEHPPSEVRWSEVGAWSGRKIHPEVQFHSLSAPLPGRGLGPRPWSYAPREAVLPEQQVAALARLLAAHTTTPDACWFCLWEGYGYFTPGAMGWLVADSGPRALRWLRLRVARRRNRRTRPSRLPSARFAPNPQRAYYLFTGSVMDAAGWEDGPNLWWPDDRTWCVASEIDLPYTYVGGSNALIEQVLAHPALETVAADVGDGVTYDSDRVNT